MFPNGFSSSIGRAGVDDDYTMMGRQDVKETLKGRKQSCSTIKSWYDNSSGHRVTHTNTTQGAPKGRKLLRSESAGCLAGCCKTSVHVSIRLRANGGSFEFIDKFPFMLSPSKHEIPFVSTLLVSSAQDQPW